MAFNMWLSALLMASSALAMRPRLAVEDVKGQVVPNSYIVQLHNSTSKSDHLSKLQSYISRISGSSDPSVTSFDITREFDFKDGSFVGYAATFNPQAVAALRTSPDVKLIEPNAIFHTESVITQSNAPPTLAKISQGAGSGTDFIYDSSGGAGVDIYIIDTGIYTAHHDFGGRARWGATFGPYANADGNGHGTFCASLAGGTKYGVAKQAGLVAVKTLSDTGSGTTADIIAGINWATSDHQATGKPAVITLALGGGASTALDNAVTAAVNAGVFVVVAAGASNTSNLGSPARVPEAITVSTTDGNAKASFANYGPLIDIWAPGVNVVGAWITGPDSSTTLSGTSWSTCYTSGLIAYIISLYGNPSSSAVMAKLHEWGVDGILTGIPPGTVNELVYNNAGLP